MNKKIILSLILVFALSMSGCIVINTGEDSSDKVKSNSQQETTSSDDDNSDDNDDNSDDNDTDKSSNSTQSVSKKPSSSSSSNSSSNYSSAYSVSGYIFYDSDSRYLTYDDIKNLSSWELKLARNEIFARHGRLFNSSSLQNYFNSCSWYDGYISPSNFNDNWLNKVELYNVDFIKKYE